MEYNDYAINPSMFETMAKEYQVQTLSGVQNVKTNKIDKQVITNLFSKLEYLSALLQTLKTHTKNNDIIIVLNEIQINLQTHRDLLNKMFTTSTAVLNTQEDNFKMFCNNLKIAINTTSDIVKLLIQIKDGSELDYEAKEKLTTVINSFLDINNNLVSLFGECRYLRF